jgi:DNA-binding response OmpR family regulator
VVDPGSWRLRSPAAVEIALTRRELAVLLLFAGRQGQPVSRQEIAAGLGEDPALYDPRRLEILIRRLRNKVGEATATDLPLVTVYGLGYAFNQPLRRS